MTHFTHKQMLDDLIRMGGSVTITYALCDKGGSLIRDLDGGSAALADVEAALMVVGDEDLENALRHYIGLDAEEVVNDFRAEGVEYDPRDKTAYREAFSEFVDYLHRDNKITDIVAHEVDLD
jgi:hypothetical protein